MLTFDFVTGTVSAGEAFRELGDIASNVFRRLLADIAFATTRILVMRALLSAFGGGTGLFGSVIRTLAGSAGVTSRVATAPQALGGAQSLGGVQVVILQPIIDYDGFNSRVEEAKFRRKL